ncbi:MAG: GNAT family N-acetyltransferase [Oscillospiraceae bacterium]|nr:GNAT family N-acetyltransferase [Oscillospiraceae bacterium]
MKFKCYDKNDRPDEMTFKMFYSLLDRVLERNEHRSCERQYELFENNYYNLLYVYDNDKYTGSLAYWDLGDLCFVEHLCVEPESQSNGYGSQLLGYVENKLHVPVVLEVEPAGTYVTDRRIRFYERCGFKLSPMEYWQMPLNDGDEPLRLSIMYTHDLNCKELERFVSLIRKIVYKKDSEKN